MKEIIQELISKTNEAIKSGDWNISRIFDGSVRINIEGIQFAVYPINVLDNKSTKIKLDSSFELDDENNEIWTRFTGIIFKHLLDTQQKMINKYNQEIEGIKNAQAEVA